MKLSTIFLFISIVFFSCEEKLEKEVINSYPSGTPMTVNYWKWEGNGKEIKRQEKFDENGKKILEIHMENGLKEGLTTYWNEENGEKWIEETFSKGKLNGIYKVWYTDGTLNYEGKYIDGLPDGQWDFYNDKGKKTTEIIYQRGKEIKKNIINE